MTDTTVVVPKDLIGRLSDYFHVNAKPENDLAHGFIGELDAIIRRDLVSSWPRLHAFVPHPNYQFCGYCGYSRNERLQHPCDDNMDRPGLDDPSDTNAAATGRERIETARRAADPDLTQALSDPAKGAG